MNNNNNPRFKSQEEDILYFCLGAVLADMFLRLFGL